eukprot:3986697-Prymnesium_polylepis.1
MKLACDAQLASDAPHESRGAARSDAAKPTCGGACCGCCGCAGCIEAANGAAAAAQACRIEASDPSAP